MSSQKLVTKNYEPNSIANFDSDQIKKHTVIILKLAIPTFFCNLLDWVNEAISMHYIAKLGNELYVGAVGLGVMFSGMAITNILFGFGNAYQTYSAQSFGRKDYYMLNIYHYRARYLQLLMIIPLTMFAFCSESILTFFGIESELAHYAYIYTIYNTPYNFALIQFDITRTFLRSQQIVNPVMIIGIIVTALGPPIQYLCIFTLGMGFKGNAIGKFVQYLINNALLIAYISISKCCKESWKLPNKKCFGGLWPLFSKGIMASLMISFEAWSYQLINFMAGLLGPIVLAASVALYNLIFLFYRTCAGVMSAAGTLVGNSIGALEVNIAKFYFLLSVIIDIFVMLVQSAIIILSRKWIASFYNPNPEVCMLFEKYVPIVCLLEIIDTINGINSNVFTGLGKQKIASLCNFISYYVVMLPLAYVIIFVMDMELKGIYYSILIGSITQLATYLFALYKVDWQKTAEEIKNHLEEVRRKSSLIVEKKEVEDII